MPSYIPAISSMSLGRACVHPFETKMDAAQAANITTIELFYEDLEVYAHTHVPSLPESDALHAAASAILQICKSRGISIFCLQPFMSYEGLVDRCAHAAAIQKMKLWISLAHTLQADLIAIPSTFLPAHEISGQIDLIVADLREVADLAAAAEPPVRLCYEALAWGTYVDVWETSWDIVQRVGRANFGLCLDTFNIAAKIYADPCSRTGTRPHADAAVKQSMQRLVKSVDREKVFYVQVVDAERLARPLTAGHELYHPQQPARMSWSRSCRLFYGEKERGAYLPIRDIAEAIFAGLQFKGVVSMELFNRVMSDPSPKTPWRLAERAKRSWELLSSDLGWGKKGMNGLAHSKAWID